MSGYLKCNNSFSIPCKDGLCKRHHSVLRSWLVRKCVDLVKIFKISQEAKNNYFGPLKVDCLSLSLQRPSVVEILIIFVPCCCLIHMTSYMGKSLFEEK